MTPGVGPAAGELTERAVNDGECRGWIGHDWNLQDQQVRCAAATLNITPGSAPPMLAAGMVKGLGHSLTTLTTLP
jgi:D-alanine-D-alanine ligase-like ATP-grasp enzyme